MVQVLWDYKTDNNNNILFNTGSIELHDSVENYDKLFIELFSSSPDQSSQDYNETVFVEIPVNTVKTAIPYTNFFLTTHGDRNNTWQISGNTLTRLDGLNTINGLVKVYGVKYPSHT